MFEDQRRQIDMGYDERLIGCRHPDEKAGGTTAGRSPAPATVVHDDGQIVHHFAEPTLTLSAVYERYLNDPTKRRPARTMLAHYTTRRVIDDVLGSTTPIAQISRESCRELLDILRWLPVNVSKKFPDIAVREAAELARRDQRVTTINPTNLNAHMARFATMMNWAVAEEYIGRNPARGLQLAETVHPQGRRQPFELCQLKRIFAAPTYTGCRDAQNGYAIPGSKVAAGARFWVPLIGLFSGMRLNEVCQLDVSDVRTIDEIACFVVSEESLSGSRDKSLKTKSRARIVPVYLSRIGLGINRFVAEKRCNAAIKLFDDLLSPREAFVLLPSLGGSLAFLVSTGTSAPRTCFHSFRHGFRDAARNAKIERDIALRLGGGITGGSQSESTDTDTYGVGYRPQVLFEAIFAIEYPALLSII